MTEPDVALTDYGITLECAVLTWLLFRGIASTSRLRRHFAMFFASAGIAALSGGTVHGFLSDQNSMAGTILWRISLLALGITAFAGWTIGGHILFTGRMAHVIEALAMGACIAYSVIVLAVDQHFWIAIANYAPSAVFLGVSLLVAHLRKPNWQTLAGLVGVVLTIVAAIVQRRHVALHATYFNHNALYHLIQMTAFGLIFLAGRHFIAAPTAAER